MAGEAAAQKDLVWVSLEEYTPSVDGSDGVPADSTSSQGDIPSIVLLNAIQLKQKDDTVPFALFPYCPGPISEGPVRVEWRLITQEPIVSQHTLCHRLQPGDSIPDIVNKCTELTAALLLVNTQQDYVISRDFKWEGMDPPPFPVCVLTSEDGHKLLGMVDQQETGEVFVRVESGSVAEVDAKKGKSPSPEELSLTLEMAKGKKTMLRRFHRSRVDLKKRIKDILTPNPSNPPLCVSERQEVFQKLMDEFLNYENAAKSKAHDGSDNSRVFQKLNKFLDLPDVFAKDCIFYIVLAYRVFKYQIAYHCDEHVQFIHKCITKFEEMAAQQRVESILKFIDSGDFTITFDEEYPNSKVFQVIERACIVLMKESHKMRSKGMQPHPHGPILSRMLWLSVSLKFKSLTGPSDGSKTWFDNMTKDPQHFQMSHQALADLEAGLQYGKHIDLPLEACFSVEQLAQLMASPSFIRPFHQLTDIIKKAEPYLLVPDSFLTHVLTGLREHYHHSMGTASKSLDKLSSLGTLLAAIQDGLTFLDTIVEMWSRKHWNHAHYEKEILQWVYLLLSAIDVTTGKTPSYLKEFLSQISHPVCGMCQRHIREQVIAEVRSNYSRLTLVRFARLYENFFIWPLEVVQEFLQSYKIPARFNVNHETMINLFRNVVERFNGAENHGFLCDFLAVFREHYVEEKRPLDFIVHLLTMQLPGLFSVEPGKTPATSAALGVPKTFQTMLREHIQRNRLTQAIISHVTAIWKSISDMSEFQLLVLSVLQDELIPESRNLQTPIRNTILPILEDTIGHLCYDIGWLTEATPHHIFAFKMVAVCCSRIVVNETLSWMETYSDIVSKLGQIYQSYCKAKGMLKEECLINDVPEEVKGIARPEVVTYFQWIVDIQKVLALWKTKFPSMLLSFDEILEYLRYYPNILSVANAVCAMPLVMSSNAVEGAHSLYQELFESLNCHLIKYIPDHPEHGWRLLRNVLTEYGIDIPQKILHYLNQLIIYPDEPRDAMLGDTMIHSLKPSCTGKFAPGHSVTLTLTKDVTLLQLKKMVLELDALLAPIKDNVDLLTYFYLRKSYIFDTYLRYQLRKHDAIAHGETLPPTSHLSLSRLRGLSGSLMGSLARKAMEPFKGISWEVLASALTDTKNLLVEIVKGTAEYTDVTAGGNLDLECMDIDVEFRVLVDYTDNLKVGLENNDGLHGIQCMLELFQYTNDIQNIYNTCEQYQMEGCINDTALTEVKAIADALEDLHSRNQLTPKEAIEKNDKIVTTLCLRKKGLGHDRQCLQLFPAVSDSTEFYKLLKEKEFYGEEGQKMFRQKYGLITAQLQHEEYNELVLNHLYAAYKYIILFLDREQDFGSLMQQIGDMNNIKGFKELHTVNKNIHLVRLWFSRAEEDTLEVVPDQLDAILTTGEYKFVFVNTVDGVKAQVFLEYQPPSTAPAPSPMRGSESQLHMDHKGASPSDNKGFLDSSSTSVCESLRREMSPPPTLVRLNRWTSEQIRDFEQRLGFLDPEKSLRANINRFLSLNQNAYKLLDLFQRLKDLGHPLYLEAEPRRRSSSVTTISQPIGELMPFREFPCSFTEQETHHYVTEAETQLKDWNTIVSELHTQFESLLFFSIPKLLHLHQKLSDGHSDSVVGEISFLFKNNSIVREKLKSSVKLLLPIMKAQAESCNAPMQVVGTFLHKLFTDYDMKRYALQPRQPYRQTARLVAAQSPAILHSCHGLSRGQLMSLIINCYNGVPESFQLFRCHSTTSEDELNLFLKRVSIHPFQYMIVGVEKLPYQLQELLLQFQLKATPFSLSGSDAVTCLNFVETGPSVLREMPWITVKEHKDGASLNHERAKKITRQGIMAFEDFSCITLVYGHAGDGKSHLIRTRLRNRLKHMVLNIPISEGFTPLTAIKKLQTLPTDTRGCCMYFNFTMLPPSDCGVHCDERVQYNQLMNTVNWFFFDLLILGYVEDPTSGESFRLPGGLAWAVFVEVPSRGQQVQPVDALSQFLEDVPTLGLVCNKEFVEPHRPYVVDDDLQLVCKYLKAFEIGGKNGIDKLYRDAKSKSKSNPPVKFSADKDLEADECLSLLDKYTPPHMKGNKTTQKLFVQYMKRRCHFLDNLPAYNFNTGGAEMTTDSRGKKITTNTRRLGSTLMGAFLKEVGEFCDPSGQADWSKKPHQQLIYDTVDGGSSIGLISLRTEQIPEDELTKFKDISITLPSMVDLHSRQWLDDYLSRALNVPLDENGLLKIIDDSGYVLTLDYTLKMLNIHERHECGMPVIIEGETGVGKTALVEVLSKLWNSAHLNTWRKTRDNVVEFIVKKMDDLVQVSPARKNACLEIVTKLTSGDDYTESDIEFLCDLPDTRSPSAQFHSLLCQEVMKLKDDPVLSLLEYPRTESGKSFNFLFRAAEYTNNTKATASLVYGVLSTKVKSTFYKLNIHAALKYTDILAFFKEISDHANDIQDAYKKFKDVCTQQIPSVTVFLDEINTASCLGLFKEIIVDRTIDGVDVPSNVFIMGACNPHRGDSLAATATDSSWVSSNYYVRSLHPTLDMLKWDYGSLDEYQERDYINAKLRLVDKDMSNVELASLAELIVSGQNMLRAFAFRQLLTVGVEETDALRCSKSCVSQRDIQRVFTFYEWLMRMYARYIPHGANEDYHRCAIMVSLSLVYYMRLNTEYREEFSEAMDKSSHLNAGYKFTDTFLRELEWYVNHMDIPRGIAKTQALKENIFSIIMCTMTTTPLIIVGPPGCSKTLSFNIVTANLRGQESKVKLFRDTTLFRSLDPHYYQCSRRTTSNEIQTVFSRGINRQNTYNSVPLPISCVVFMDEAGLPEESLESLKVLHYHLDRRDISFVAISNHMLDAAKTNRAVSLFRSEPSIEELKTLAKGCLCDSPLSPPAELKKDIDIIVKFCPIYHSFMGKPEFSRFYGLRDFIHFINYLERNRKKGITEHLVLRALERNFNGHKLFETICKEFLGAMGCNLIHVPRNNILNILKESLSDKPQETLVANPNEKIKENEVRYKLIIDSSEDNSLLRLLFAFDILKEKETRTYVCSDFPGDSHQQMINTIAAIRHSAAAGHTVIMSQTDELHESFYDLFNQRFRRIDDPKTGPRFYANIAIGAHHKPCRVHPSFQCVVVVKRSEIDTIPHPFLNRFEKYSLTHKILLDAVLSYQPPYLRSVILRAKDKASEFIKHVGGVESLYGIHDDTLDSLMLSLLPPVGFQEFLETDKPQKEEELPQDLKGRDLEVFLVRRLLRALRKRAGFRLPHFAREELSADAECVMRLVARDSQFAGQLSALTVNDVVVAIPEALKGLYYSSSKDRHTDLSINACMIISVFLQWIVRHICKRLMQLMTTEALTTRYKALPHHYTESYLKHQSHFNLQALIDKQLQVMQLDDAFDRSTTGTANRLLLVTRSSALIHQLPARYPAPKGSVQLSSDYDSLIQKTVYYYSEDVCVYKLSNATTQGNINELLNTFWLSKKQRILLLVANMKETSQEMISHLRVMIEENDTGEKLKLFVVLLHFPPSMFNSPCYPILFSNTWDHHYLDIIGQNATGQVIDICQWFSLCCSYLSSRHSKQDQVPLNLSAILYESIPMISSRVFFGKNEDAPFNCPMVVPQRNTALREFFDTGVGEILCEKFLRYWEPRVMLEYLEKAAAVATTVQTNTLSITDSLQTILRDTFFDFVVHIVSKMNEDMNIDILMHPSCSQSTTKLFLALLRSYPMPKLSQIKTLSGFANSISNVEAFQNSIFNPQFPFYRLVSSGLERIIEQTRKEINQRLDTLHEFPDPSISLSQMSITSLPKVIEDKSHLVVNMQKEVEYAITQILESKGDNPLKVAIEAMLHDPDLFKRYSEAFTHQKLRLGAPSAGISFKLLRMTFLQLHPDQDILTRLALLHICMHVYQLDLSRLVQVLRPLDILLEMAAVVPNDPYSAEQPSPTASFLSAVKESGDLLGQPGDLSKYVLKILFSALVGSLLSQDSSECSPEENLSLWYEVYKDVMSIPAVRDYLYQNLTDLAETQHNIMHTVYLVILAFCDQDDSDLFSLAEKVFNILFTAHFMDKMELKGGSPPRLQEISELLAKEIMGSSVESVLQCAHPLMRQIFEGLLEHFFSPHRHSFSADSSIYYLRLINTNHQWNHQTTPTEPTPTDDITSASVHESLLMASDSPITRHISLSTSEDHEGGKGCIPMSVYKHYLSIVLDKSDTSNVGKPSMSTLALYKPWIREMIGQVLAEAKPRVKRATPYIPLYYQAVSSISCPKASENELMQQPLAHLYFTTVFHHLLSNNFDLPGLVRVASAIQSNLQNETAKEKLVLLFIEQQAVIQAVIQQLAKSLGSDELNGISAIARIITDINLLLNDRTLGGGGDGGHGIALALNLFKELGSVSKFTDFLKPNSMNKDFSCLRSLSVNISVTEEHHLFPFLFYVSKGNVLKDLYVNVGQAMLRAHTSGGRKCQPLIAIANEWSQGTVNISLPDGQDVQGDKSGIFKMVFWLNTYHKFFSQKKPSPHLAEMLDNKEQLKYIVQPPEINRLLQCFLDPALMLQEHSSPQGDIAHYQDPVYALFNPEKNEDTPSDASLRDALVNLVAVVIAAPPTSTHLWYHMFAADQLKNTHLAGVMHESPVGQDVFYNTGVQLTEDGLYQHDTSLKHALRGTLSLQSLYLLLWSNVGAFCVGLLTDPEAEGKMKGSVFPESFSVRHYCVKQLRSMWQHLSTSLGIAVEERSFLVSRSMWSLLKIGCGSQASIASGKFTSMGALNYYESQWHSSVFLPVWSNLRDAFTQHANLSIHQIFKDMQALETHYPFFPSEHSLLQSLLSQTDIGDYVSNTEHVLSQFALYQRQLEVGGELLPILVELYQWLHQELAYVITRKDAESIPLSRAVRVLARSYSVDEGERLLQLYKRLKELYNQYRGLSSSGLPPLEDTTPLLHALSCGSNGETTPDILYTAISGIITTHNNFLVKAENAVRADSHSSLHQYLPQDFSRVHPTEFTDQNCIVRKSTSLHGLSDFSQLICKHSSLSCPSPHLPGPHTSLPGYLPLLINLKTLQEDVFATQLAGKPLIGPPQSLRTRFDFRDSKHLAKENLSAIEADVLTISDKLLDEFKALMTDTHKSSLRNHFHSASYSTIMETVSGLRGVAGHLIKKLMGVSQLELRELQELTLSDFLSSVLGTHEPLKSITGSKRSIFHEIGINNLSINQFNALEIIPLTNLHDALKWFVTWASQGWYEYCSLPLSMKAPLSPQDQETLTILPDTYTENNAQLLMDLKALKLVLNHFESNSTITTTALKQPQLSINDFLSHVGESSKHEVLLEHVPSSVHVVHYVAFRVAVKQLIIQLQRTLSSEDLSIQPHKQSWEDFIEDLWEHNLSNFRQGQFSYAVVTTSDQKKRVYSLKNINRSDEDLLNDLMKAGVSESELLPDTDNEDSSSNDCISFSDKSPVTTPFLPPAKPTYSGQIEDPEASYATAITAPKKEHITKRMAEAYTPQQVQSFLQSIGMEEYVSAFKEMDIAGDVLLMAGQGSALADLGVSNPLHRLKISVLFRRQLEGVGKIAKRYPVEEVVRFLHAHKMSEFVGMFEQQCIDGEMLMEAGEEVLNELGVTKQIQKLALKSSFKKYITPRFTTL